jgi:hypothetical protein
MKLIKKGKVVPSSLEYHKWKIAKTICIDLDAKWAEIIATGSDEEVPDIWLSYNKNTLHLKNRIKSDVTALSFPEFKGYTIICSGISKYTLTITFVKD